MAYSGVSHTSFVTLLARVSSTSVGRRAAWRACLALSSARPLDVLASPGIAVIVA
jgi:hypothetical protein